MTQSICIHGNSLYAWACAAVLSDHYSVCLVTPIASLDQNFLTFEPGLIARLTANQNKNKLQWIAHAAHLDHSIHIIASEDSFEVVRVILGQIAHHKSSRYIVVTALFHMDELKQLAHEVDSLSTDIHPLDFIYMPEFLREGHAISDVSARALLLVSGNNPDVAAFIAQLFEPFTTPSSVRMVTSHQNAELITMSINAMLATRISFMNEIALIADETGADIRQIERGIGADPRIGSAYLSASCGFGGTKFSQNIQHFMDISAKYLGYPGLIQTVYNINESQKETLFRKIWQHFLGDLAGKHFAIWGCAYKANSSSTQLGAIHTMLKCLWSQQCSVSVYDPQALPQLHLHYPNHPQLHYAENALTTLLQADALIILTDWDEFKHMDITQIIAALKNPIIFDGRNIFDVSIIKQHPVHYYGIGQKSTISS